MRLLILVAALAACSKSDNFSGGSSGGSASGGGGDTAGPRGAVIEAWKKGGLTPSAFTAAQVAVGTDCQSGTVGAVDTLLCVFPSNAEAKAAEPAGLGWIGDTTGAAQAYGSVLVCAADRRKADPSGRTINQMMKLAPR